MVVRVQRLAGDAVVLHGLLAHSFTSTSQLPLSLVMSSLSKTVQLAVPSEMWSYSHQPLEE